MHCKKFLFLALASILLLGFQYAVVQAAEVKVRMSSRKSRTPWKKISA